MIKKERERIIARVTELYNLGVPQVNIAKEFGVTERTVYNWLRLGGQKSTLESIEEAISYTTINKGLGTQERRVLVIGDLHIPFEIENALEFAIKTYKEYNCNQVIFMGDILDNHTVSYHEVSPESVGGQEELNESIRRLEKWYKAFPEAIVLIGNHDALIQRKAQTGMIPKQWIREYAEVLGVPNWEFVIEYQQDDIKYIHGVAGKAAPRMRKDLISIVSGHYHNDFYINYAVGENYRIFGMQAGCLVDRDTYGMAYARHFPKQAIGLGVILNNGKLPILVPAELKENKILLD